MTSLTDQPWFGWALVVIIGFPVALIVLSEIHSSLLRRGSALARPVRVLRSYALPAGALLILLTKTADVNSDNGWVRLVGTTFGLLALILALSVLNVALFTRARPGTWRERLPSIFVDIARLIIVAIGLAILFAQVWGTDVGGLFAALGVTSIVLGLSLQTAVGSVISGLFLLFEQPFRLGDWLDVGGVRGRVVEVNWRAVHIDTGNSLQIMPNATLAAASFANLSRPLVAHDVSVESAFSTDDPPDSVIALLDRIAADLPRERNAAAPSTIQTGPKSFVTGFTVSSPADADLAASTFRRWSWYAARRSGLHLDGAAAAATPAEIEIGLRSVATSLHVEDADVPDLVPLLSVQRFGAGETVQRVGDVPSSLRFILRGQLVWSIPLADGARQPVGTLVEGEYIGQNSLTREAVRLDVQAVGEVNLLVIPRPVLDALVTSRPTLARDMGKVIEERRRRARALVS